MKKRKTSGPLNVTFAPSPPSSPRRIRFAEVTQIKRDIRNFRSRLTNYTSTPANHRLFEYTPEPPSAQGLVSTTDDYGIPSEVYQEVYYSKEVDAPDHAKEYAGILFRIQSGTGLSALEEWDEEDGTRSIKRKKDPLRLPRLVGIEGWEYSKCPPSSREIQRWLLSNPAQTETGRRKTTWASQVSYYVSTS